MVSQQGTMRSGRRTAKKATTTPLRPLHVVLEHRNSNDFKTYLEFLQKKHSDKLPSKLGIFADFQWLQNGQIITLSQRQQLFDALSEICGNLRHLQIDLLCDLFLPDLGTSFDVDLSASESKHSDESSGADSNSEDESSGGDSSSEDASSSSSPSGSEASDLIQRLQVLPCSLLTRLVNKAPLLETLALKELFLSGSPEDVQELVDCLRSHPTLQQVDLRWKLAGSSAQNCRLLDPLISGIASMPHLQELNLMIPHWSSSLQCLPRSNSLGTVKLTVERIPDPASMTKLLRDWKTNTVLKNLEASSFQILHDTSALLELIGTHNSQLQRLVVVDHNVFRARKDATSRKAKRVKSSSKASNQFAQELAQVLKENTTLRHLHLISKSATPRRRGSNIKKSEQIQAHHREVLGDAMEGNYVLEHLEISHAGVQISAPTPTPVMKKKRDAFLDSPHGFHKQTTSPPASVSTDKLDFYLRLNQDGYRRQLLLKGENQWHQAVEHYQQDTASLFSLIQAAPFMVDTLLQSSLSSSLSPA